DRLWEQAKQDLAAGQPVLGEQWALDGNKLTLKLDTTEVECTLQELATIDVLENNLCFWRLGEDEAFARIPAQTANTQLLQRLINEHLSQRPPQADQPPPEGQLGRILFERKPHVASSWFLLIMAVICFGSGPVLVVMGQGQDSMILLGLGIVVLGGLFLLGMF